MVARRKFDAYFDAGLRNWIYKHSRKNYWRVSAWMDLEDLIQEGYLCFAICRQRYADKVENKNHFMSLVKITFINQITDLANRKSRTPEMPMCEVAEAGNDQEFLEALAGGEDGDAELANLFAHAPKEIRMLMAAIASDEGAAMLRRPYRRRADGTRETRNERMCRLAGVPLFDFEGAVRDLIEEPNNSTWQWALFFKQLFTQMDNPIYRQ